MWVSYCCEGEVIYDRIGNTVGNGLYLDFCFGSSVTGRGDGGDGVGNSWSLSFVGWGGAGGSESRLESNSLRQEWISLGIVVGDEMWRRERRDILR